MKKNHYTASRQSLRRILAALTAALLLFTMGVQLPARATDASDVSTRKAGEYGDRGAGYEGEDRDEGDPNPDDPQDGDSEDFYDKGFDDPDGDAPDLKDGLSDPQDDLQDYEEIQAQYGISQDPADDSGDDTEDDGDGAGEDYDLSDQMSGDVDSAAALTEQFDLEWDGDEDPSDPGDADEAEQDPNADSGDEDEPCFEYEYLLRDMEPVALSAILEETGLPLALEDIEGLGVVGTPEETEGLIAIERSEEDYIITPLERFEALELTLEAGEALYILRLTQEIEPEPEGEMLAAPAEETNEEPALAPLKVSFARTPRFGNAGSAMQATLRVEGGEAPYAVYSAGEEILVEDEGEAQISATPQEGGDFAWHVVVTDARGNEAGAEASVPVADDAQNEPNPLPELTDGMRLSERLIAIARSQVGYHECSTNFIIDDNDIRQGWNWYGAQLHAPYTQWCAIFVDYCLDEAGIGEDLLTRSASCHRWVESLPAGLYVDNEDSYDPAPGDIVFFHHDRAGSSDAPNFPNHVGIVVERTETGIVTVEGNSGNAVREHTYALDNRSIVGYIPLSAVTGEGLREYREIETRVDGRTIRVAGSLPADAQVQAVAVPLESAQAVLDAQAAEDAPAQVALFAYDISILSGGVKFQPQDFGESVTVTFIDAQLEGELGLLHVKTDVTDGAGNLDEEALSAAADDVAAQTVETETLTPEAAEADQQSEVSFEVDSFSLMIAYRNGVNYKVTYTYTEPVPSNVPALPEQRDWEENTEFTVASKPTMEGYTLSDWTSSDVAVNEGKFTMPSKDVTLTAAWAINSHNVTYAYTEPAPTGVPAVPASVVKDYGVEATVEPKPTMTGYTLSDWTTGNTEVSGGKFTMPDRDVAFTGTWTINKHNVTYAYVEPAPADVPAEPTENPQEYSAEVTVKGKPTMTGYTLSDWTTGDAEVFGGKFIMPDKEVTLTGTWEINKHSITYVFAGDIPSEVTKPENVAECEYGTPVDLIEYQAVEGYTFKGWSGVTITDNSFTMPDEDVTLTGTWEINKHKVTYQFVGTLPDNPPALPTDDTKHDYNSDVTVTQPTPALEGFSGWFLDGENVDSGFRMPDEDVILVGGWNAHYTICHILKGTADYEEPKVVKTDEGDADVGESIDIAFATTHDGIALTPVNPNEKTWTVDQAGDVVHYVEYTIPLKITPRDQTFSYDEIKAIGETKTYTGTDIDKNVKSVSGLLGGDTLSSVTLKYSRQTVGIGTISATAAVVTVGNSSSTSNRMFAAANAETSNAALEAEYYTLPPVTATLTVTGKLTLTKTTTGSTTPNTAVFKVIGPNGYSKEFKYSEFKSNKLEIPGLSAGNYTVTESKADVSGYTLSTTYDKQTVTLGESNPAPEIKITNTYKAKDTTNDDPTTSTPTSSPTPSPAPTRIPADDDDDGPDEPTVEIDGEKIWEDFSNAYHTRPSDVEIRLYANGELVEDADFHWVSRAGDTWQFTFGDMPASIDGESVIYSVQEAPVANYDPILSGMTITNRLVARLPEAYGEFSGVKRWQDDDDSQRPGYVVVRLLRNGEPIAQRTVTAANGWTYSFGERPLDDGYGHDYEYEVREDGVKGYFATYDEGTITNVALPVAEKKDVGTRVPNLEGITQEELESLVDVSNYTTPLTGGLLPTGDETPIAPFAFALAGLAALLVLALADRRRIKGTR